MADNTYDYTSRHDLAPKPTTAQQAVNGANSMIQDAKNDFRGPVGSRQPDEEYDGAGQPMSHFHSLFHDLFTWKFPKFTGFFFLSTISLIVAFRYVNVLRYVFKAFYVLFAIVAAVEVAGKPLGAKGVVSSFRPRRYYTIPRESLDQLFEQLHGLANFFVLEFQRVLFVENISATFAAFVTSFISYILIKYIPFWALLLLTTVSAFTMPLIYINNRELIDEQVQRASDLYNAQLESTKKVTSKYAEDAAASARAKAADLQSKVQAYTNKAAPRASSSPAETRAGVPSGASAHDYYLSSAPNAPSTPLGSDYPRVPSKEPGLDKPLMS